MGPFYGLLDGQDSQTKTKRRIRLDADKGDVLVGGQGSSGDISVYDDQGVRRIWLDAGMEPQPGPELTTTVILIDGKSGTFSIRNAQNHDIITLGSIGELSIGAKDRDDFLLLKDKRGKLRIYVSAERAKIALGGNDEAGDLLLYKSNGDNQSTDDATIWLNGADGNILLRSTDSHGKLSARVHLISAESTMEFRDKDNNETIRLDGGAADIYLGGNQKNGRVVVKDKNGNETVVVDGETGDITLNNADFAEEFEVEADVEPGTVMVIEQEGRLRQSQEAYDRKVAGVVSRGGEYKPGIILDKRQSDGNRMPVALVGKVFCKVDAQFSRIEVGDLLTTSPTPGHAMKATDPFKAFGAVIGKALRPLDSGAGLIPILIALQ